MPSDENDFNFYNVSLTSKSKMLSKAEIRKTHKPIMEKKRRAKINNSLNEIKSLVLSALNKDPERHSKLEKADILEMAVRHLQAVERRKRDEAMRADADVARKFRNGFRECMHEIDEYIDRASDNDAAADPALRMRIRQHLASAMNNQPAPFSISSTAPSFGERTSSNLLAALARNHVAESTATTAPPANLNVNYRGIELIPSCLPNGDFAFVVPKAMMAVRDVNTKDDSNLRPSAFVTVLPNKSTTQQQHHQMLSPPISPTSSTDEGAQTVATKTVVVTKPVPTKPVPLNAAVSTIIQRPIPTIQQIKYPIQPERMRNESAPLSIITNNCPERQRQAQQLSESRLCAENVFRGVKRAFVPAAGLLTIAQAPIKRPCRSEAASSVSDVIYCDESDSDSEDDEKKDADVEDADKEMAPEKRGDQGDGGSSESCDPMWRPW